MRNICLLAFILLYGIKAYTQQEYSQLPIHFNQYLTNPYNNLAFGGIKGTEATLLARQNFGNFGNVNTQYFSSFFSLKEKNESSNALGLIIYNDKEGDYLRTNRFYGSFIRHQKISDNWKLSLGVSAGTYLFRVKFNSVTGGISESAFDASASLGLSGKNTKICISFNQLLNTPLKTSNSDLSLRRFIVVNAIQKFNISDDVHVKTGGYYKPLNLNSNDIFRLGLSTTVFYQKVGAGLIYDVGNGFSMLASIENINIINNHKIDFQVSYFSPFANNLRQRVEVLELSLKYFFEKK